MMFMVTSSVTRYRHNWVTTYSVDNTTIRSWTQYLPVISTASTTLKKGVWYTWGEPVTVELYNDGETHTFKIAFTCETKPIKGSLTVDLKLPKYKITPGKPSGLEISWNEDTNEVTYKIGSAVNASTINLTRTLYGENGEELEKNTSISIPVNKLTYTEVISEAVYRISWWVRAYSVSKHTADTDGPALNLDRYNPIWVKVGNGWKKTKAWVRVNGVWKRITHIQHMKG